MGLCESSTPAIVENFKGKAEGWKGKVLEVRAEMKPLD